VKASTIRAEGMWTRADGRQVLFNRYYRPIYERHPGQRGPPLTAAMPWIEQQSFFNNGNASVSYWGTPAALWKAIVAEIDRT
jgi:hypothetical protein